MSFSIDNPVVYDLIVMLLLGKLGDVLDGLTLPCAGRLTDQTD